MWGGDRKLIALVQKNLIAHFSRNQKTALMFTLCLAYLLFARCMFALQSNSIAQSLQWTYGSDIQITSSSVNSPLPVDLISSIAQQTDLVTGTTKLTFPITWYNPVDVVYIQNLASVGPQKADIVGVQKNFLDVVVPTMYIPYEYNPTVSFTKNVAGKYDVVNQLYEPFLTDGLTLAPNPVLNSDIDYNLTRSSNQAYSSTTPLLISAALRASPSNLQVGLSPLLQIWYNYQGTVDLAPLSYIGSIVALVTKMPAITSISRTQLAGSTILCSVDDYIGMVNEIGLATNTTSMQNYTSDSIPIQSLFLSLDPSASDLTVLGLVNLFISSLQGSSSITINNLRSQINSTQGASDFMGLVFNIGEILT